MVFSPSQPVRLYQGETETERWITTDLDKKGKEFEHLPLSSTRLKANKTKNQTKTKQKAKKRLRPVLLCSSLYDPYCVPDFRYGNISRSLTQFLTTGTFDKLIQRSDEHRRTATGSYVTCSSPRPPLFPAPGPRPFRGYREFWRSKREVLVSALDFC